MSELLFRFGVGICHYIINYRVIAPSLNNLIPCIGTCPRPSLKFSVVDVLACGRLRLEPNRNARA